MPGHARIPGARAELVEGNPIPASPLKGTRDLGWMLYDLDFTNPKDIQPKFFRGRTGRDGLLDLRSPELRG